MQFSDGVKIRAQIDTDSMKAMLAVAGGGSVALLAFLPYLLGKPDMEQLARAVVWGLISFQASLLLCLVHNVLRRHCSATYERAWSDEKQPKPGKILGWQLKTHPGVCFWSWTFLWLAVVTFGVGSITICVGGLSTLNGEAANASEVAVLPSAKQEPNATSILEVVTVAPPATRESQELFTESNPEASDPRSSSETIVDPAAPWPENLRAKLQLEPKDDSWAYYMEQTLLQFLSTHSSIDQFDVSRIECRTSTCQIVVFGFDESTVPVWSQVMYDIQQQPWSEFGEYGSSSGTVDDRLTIVGTLTRKPESE